MKTINTLLVAALLTATLAGCTTLQTTYFRGSYQPLIDPNSAALQPSSGAAKFQMVSDMATTSDSMYSQGYAMIGYSEFVSPLMQSLAPGYATKFAGVVGAEYAVMQTPVRGDSNLSHYLVTYWARVRPEGFGLGTYTKNLPDELLDRLGQDYNVVYVAGVVPGTPAAAAGLQKDDVVLAVNGRRVTSAKGFRDDVRQNYGDEIQVSVSRYGKHLVLPVVPTAPHIAFSDRLHHERPWENTAARDWSSLSAANITARVVQQQVAEQQRKAAYERGRADALAAQASMSRNSSSAYSSYSSRQCRQRGSFERRGQNDCAESSQWQLDFSGALKQQSNLQDFSMKGDSLNMFFSNYSNIYGQFYTYPR